MVTGDPQPESYEVVGVVGDARIDAIERPAPMTMYTPYYQFPMRRLHFMIRARLSPEALVETVRRVVAAEDRDIPVESLESLDRLIGDSLASQRVSAVAVTLFSAMAMLLACIGLYGVLAYSVSQRTHEFGIRIALGARSRTVPGMVLRQGLVLALAGVGLGVGGSLALARYISGMLFEVRAEPWTLAGTSLGLLGVTMLASYVPALRAAKIDPVVALRCQ